MDSSPYEKSILISKELSEFLNEQNYVLLKRSYVTKKIFDHIKENDLSQIYICKLDSKLAKLFNLNINDEISLFNLQSYLDKHFIYDDNSNIKITL